MLSRCNGCRRFVRAADATCPFCSAEVEHRAVRIVPRMSRAAALALAATTVACSSSSVPLYGAPAYGAPAYGDPPYDSGMMTDARTDSPVDAGGNDAGDAGKE